MPIMNEAGLALLKEYEGCRLSAYLDSGGIATLGYGHVAGVNLGMTCTQEQADAWLAEDSQKAVDGVSAAVKVDLTENERAACSVLAYNIGVGAFRTSTLCRLLNAGDRAGAARSFLMWDKATVGGKLTELPGLQRRRAAEMHLFLTPDVDIPARPEESGISAVEPPKSLTASRTITGAAISAVAGGAPLLDAAKDQLGSVHDTFEYIGIDATYLGYALAAVAVLGALAAIAARISDRRAGRN